MEQKIPFGPSWSRAGWDFLLHLEKYPGSHETPLLRTPAAGIPRRPRPRTAPPAPPESGCRERKGALLSEGPLGDLEAKPGFEPGVKALQASALPLGHFAVDMKRADSKTGPMHAMERTTGLEPATPTLARLCSTN